MTRRTLWISRPGVEGKISDLDAHQLPAGALADGSDAIKPNGIVRQRRGWAYDGTTADVAANLISAYRAKFVAAGVTRTITADTAGESWIHNPAGAGTGILTSTNLKYLARCVYGDAVVLCAQDGISPVRFYGGAALNTDFNGSTSPSTTIGQSIFTTASTWAAGVTRGAYVGIGSDQGQDTSPFYYARVGERISSTVLSLRNVQTSLAGAQWDVHDAVGCGFAYPAVEIYDTGTGTLDAANDRVDGTGTVWTGGTTTVQIGVDGFLVKPSGADAAMYSIGNVNSATRITFSGAASRSDANTPYAICRRLPFKDAAAHKGRLWGIGVAEHKTRLYVSPVGWDPALPPGAALPFDPSVFYQPENYLDCLLDFVDVPAPDDADECVAVLSSPSPLVILKRDSAHGTYEDAPPFGSSLLPDGHGAGCIDVRSAWELPIGPVWASQQGVLAFMGGAIRDLTDKRINREWRSLVADFDYGTSDFCTTAWADGVMLVTLITGGGATKRAWYVYPYDEAGKFNPAWFPVTNISPRFAFSSSVAGEEEKLLIVQDDDQGRVIDLAPSINGTGIARDGDGTSPALDLTFGSNIARLAGANVDERLLQMSVEANLYDSGGASSTLGGSVASSQSLDSDATITTSLTSMASKTADLPKPYVHTIGVKAGLHQPRLTKSATQTTELKAEITRLGFTVRRSAKAVSG